MALPSLAHIIRHQDRLSDPPPMRLVEAYFMAWWAGPQELARLTGMTMSEVIEGLEKRGLPMGPIFDREREK